MHPCGERFGRMYFATLGYAGSPSTLKRRKNLIGTAIRYPTEDIRKGTEGTAPEITRRDRTMGALQDVVLEEVVPLVGYRTGLTAEAEVRKRVMVTRPTPPTKKDRGRGVAVRTDGTEVGRHRKNGLIGGMGENKYL